MGNTFGALAPIVLFIQVAGFDVEEVAQKLTALVLRTLAILLPPPLRTPARSALFFGPGGRRSASLGRLLNKQSVVIVVNRQVHEELICCALAARPRLAVPPPPTSVPAGGP